ncbi:hypothetical protein C475_09142 [Halosimplex carlsbadense 2-9-1]|uniref:Uncharacterized protein n=1 Tax=Halosimplex carlsbadense 2-9-1 TaxID=797114 RepID=M0CUM2_9EURY|nr:hypothetical protein [Halosimplex carlsbadense]ELZ26343.1 hypothetical protein C475_09142 [Halosimplex carlsbadense 2-9-1]
MNRHFEDSLYYLKRAVRTARTGVREELAPVEDRVRALVGREREPEPGRIEAVRSELETIPERVRGEAGAVVAEARETVGEYRGGEAGSQ